MKNYYYDRKKVLIIVCLFFSFCKPAVQAQQADADGLRQLFFQELSKAMPSKSLPAEKSIRFQQLSANELSRYKLNAQPADAFYINATADALAIRSASAAGLRNGVYWYLAHLGFRYYFPNNAWHFAPTLRTPFKPVEKTVAPSYTHRRIWYAYGTGSKKADADYRKWVEANLLGGIEVAAGHAYDGIVARNKAVFQQHPEYFAQKVTKGNTPPNPKFDVTNEALVQLCISDAYAQIESIRKEKGQLPGMISMDPSDGGGYDADTEGDLNTPGEQVFYLANKVARAVREKYPSVRVGMYAYYQHAAPPPFALEPNLVVLIATAMNQSAYRTDELLNAWQKKEITLGIRDYYGVMAWDWDMPGQPGGSRLVTIKQLKTYYSSGIRLFSAETNVGWISRGLGHYIAAQLLWDVSMDMEEEKHGFFKNMFGAAAADMEKLFDAWQDYRQPIPPEGDLLQWSRLVERAGNAEKNGDVQARINQVKRYLHYVYLFAQWRGSSTDENFVRLLNYAYRIQDEGSVASYPLFRRLAGGAVKAGLRFNTKNAVWKQNNQPVSEPETEQLFNADLRAFNPSKTTVVTALPQTFAPASATRTGTATSVPLRLRGGHTLVFHINNNGATINLSSGLIKAREYKTLRLKIYPYNSSLQTNDEEALINETLPPKQALRPVALRSLQPGTYIAVIDDARNGFVVSFTGAVSYGIVAGGQARAYTFSRNSLVFAVTGVKSFSVRNDGAMTLRSPKGRIIDLQKKKGVFTIDVQPGEEGIWKLQNQSGVFNLQGIVPLVSSEETFLLQNKS